MTLIANKKQRRIYLHLKRTLKKARVNPTPGRSLAIKRYKDAIRKEEIKKIFETGQGDLGMLVTAAEVFKVLGAIR